MDENSECFKVFDHIKNEILQKQESNKKELELIENVTNDCK